MNSFSRFLSATVAIFALAVGVPAKGADALAELAAVSSFKKVDLDKLAAGTVLIGRGPAMNFPRGLAVESAYVIDGARRHRRAGAVGDPGGAAPRHPGGDVPHVGLLGEAVDDIAATVEHVKRCNPNIFFTTVAYPIKNTAYYREVADQVVMPPDWAAATDRDYEVAGRPGRAYYGHADQWLKSEVEAARLEASDPAQAAAHHRAAGEAKAALLALGA